MRMAAWIRTGTMLGALAGLMGWTVSSCWADTPLLPPTAQTSMSDAPDPPWMAELDQLLKAQRYADARQLLFRPGVSPSAAVARLHPWLDTHTTPILWLYAERLWYAGRPQESADWVYAADLSLRMDASVCSDSNVIGFEQRIVHAFAEPVQAARQNPSLMRDAVVFALEYATRNLDHPGDPRWLCSLSPNANPKRLTLPSSEWQRRRQGQINFFKAASTRE